MRMCCYTANVVRKISGFPSDDQVESYWALLQQPRSLFIPTPSFSVTKSAQSGVLTVEPDPVGDCVPVNGLISPRGIRIASISMYTYPEELATACAVAGVMLIFLSPYCPFWNPVELVFSQIKSFLRRHAPEFHRVFRMSRK